MPALVLDPETVLRSAARILLVDWPAVSVPRTLISAGFTVFGYSPAGYSEADIVAEGIVASERITVFPPMDPAEAGYLRFRRLAGSPRVVNVVCVYRPEDELEGIIRDHVLPLKASVLWIQPPNKCKTCRDLAARHDLTYIDGTDIAETASALANSR